MFVDLTGDLTCSLPGYTMNNLAKTYSALGRQQEALVLFEKALEFFRRVLPQDHPDLGSTFCF